MAASDIDGYLAGLDGERRAALQHLRESILRTVPDAEECLAYGSPAFRVHGKTVAGFAAYQHHLSYLPHSGSVLGSLAGDLGGYTVTKGALHFGVDAPLPDDLVGKLVAARLRELGLT